MARTEPTDRAVVSSARVLIRFENLVMEDSKSGCHPHG
jgi:hypothetical protein